MTPSQIAQQILARLGEHRAGKLPPERRTYTIEQLEPLARDYLSRTGSTGERLSDYGAVYVTLTAARQYGAAERIHDDERARRELTELLVDAKPVADRVDQWRMRKRSTGLDVTARAAKDGGLMVVTHVHVRDANVGGRRG